MLRKNFVALSLALLLPLAANADVYRSVCANVMNATQDDIAVDGFEVFQGQWQPGAAPQENAVFPANSTWRVCLDSHMIGVAPSGNTRLSSRGSYINLEMQGSVVGQPKLYIQHSENLFKFDVSRQGLSEFNVTIQPQAEIQTIKTP